MIIGVCPNHEKIRNIIFWSIEFWAEPFFGDTPICDTHKIRYRIGGNDKALISLISYDMGYSTTHILHIWQDGYNIAFSCHQKESCWSEQNHSYAICAHFLGAWARRETTRYVGSSGCPRTAGVERSVEYRWMWWISFSWSSLRNKSSSDLQKWLHFLNELWSKRGMNGLCSSGSQMSGSDMFIKNLKCWVILEGKMAKCPRTAVGRSAKQIPGHQRGQNSDWHRPWGVLCWVWYGWKLTSAHWHHADNFRTPNFSSLCYFVLLLVFVGKPPTFSIKTSSVHHRRKFRQEISELRTCHG